MKVNITVCDVCEDPKKETAAFMVGKNDGEPVAKDLCPTHAAPLEVLLGNRKRTGRPPAKKAAAAKVSTMEEIEAQKTTAPARKTAAKKV